MQDTVCCLKNHAVRTVLWKITDACNVRCAHCLTDGRPWHADKWADVIEELQHLDIRRVVLTGGEPLLHPELTAIVGCLRRCSDVTVISNGLLLTSDKAAALKASGLNSMDISLQSHNGRVQDDIYGQARAHAKVVDAIALCHQHSIPVSISVTLLPCNEHALGELIDFCFSLGARAISVNSLLPPKRGSSALTSWASGWASVSAQRTVTEKRARYGQDTIKTSRIFPPGDDFRCPAGRSFWGVSASGKWHPCLLAEEMRSYIPNQWFAHFRADNGHASEEALGAQECPVYEIMT